MSFYEQHRDLIAELERITPKGVRIEWSGDTLIMMAGPTGIHQGNIRKIRRQFEAFCPDGLVPSEGTELTSPTVDKARIPDLSFLPEAIEESPESKIPAEEAAIAVEVVSPSNPGNDWGDKLRDYAVMGIPLYLIVDPREKTVTLFSDPNHDGYHTRSDRKFGDRIRIPEPFGFDLDTTGLVAYPDA